MAENVLPLFTEEQIDKGSQFIDDLLKLKGFGEAIDGPVSKFTLKQVNKYASGHVPDDLKPDLQDVFNEILEKDFDDAGAELTDVIGDLVADANLKPGVKDLIIGALSLVKGAIASLD